MKHIMMKTILLTALLSAVPYAFSLGPIPHTGNDKGERFAPVTLASGQSIRAVIANLRIPDPGDSTDPCAVMVSFFGADGSLIGGVQTSQLAPGASESVLADSAAGLVRVIVSLQNSDAKKLCAVKGNVEVFDSHTGGTLFLLPGQNCLGAEPCSTPLRP